MLIQQVKGILAVQHKVIHQQFMNLAPATPLQIALANLEFPAHAHQDPKDIAGVLLRTVATVVPVSLKVAMVVPLGIVYPDAVDITVLILNAANARGETHN